jgi:hypothetical protein
MKLLEPTLPDFDLATYRSKPYPERLKMACQSWVLQGYGTPLVIYVFYLLKVAFYIWAWTAFCKLSPGIEGFRNISDWWYTPVAFQKAVLWSMAFEVLGLGCASGPLTGRYKPPIGGFLHCLRPGTIKLPVWPGMPLLGGSKRSWLDVGLYAALCFFLFKALLSPTLELSSFLPIVILLPILGVSDQTIFLMARSEHYYTALVCFLFAGDWLPASKLLWLGIWMWAAISKLNRHFPSVISVMQANSPLTEISPSFRKAMVRNFPEDLRPSKLAERMAHFGAFVEMTFPLVLVFSDGGTSTTVALTVMLLFHLFITSSIPMGVPIEWNFMMVYGGFVLFGHYAEQSAFDIHSPLLIAYLFFAIFLVPLLGNLFPSKVSFLLSMRYYAGNWAYSAWLFKGQSSKKLDEHIKKTSPTIRTQLAGFYDDEETPELIMSRLPAFRAMHLQGRVLSELIPKAVDDMEDYEYADGEVIAGIVLGWNFGDGHLHDLQLLQTVQQECQFEPGELRCIFVESQPFIRQSLSWTIADAVDGVLEEGETWVKDMLPLQPWGKSTG